MKSLIKQLLILIYFFWPLILSAQNNDLMRIEISAQLENDAYSIIPCRETGFLLFYESVEAFDDKHTSWIFSLFGTDMEQSWTRNIPVLNDAGLHEWINGENASYLVFYDEGRSRKDDFNLQVVKFDHSGEVFISVYGNVEEKGDIIDLEASGGDLYIGMNLRKYETAVYHVDYNASQVDQISSSLQDKNMIEDLYFDKQENKLFVIINHFLSRKENYLILKSIKEDGALIDSVILRQQSQEIELNAARLRRMDDQSLIVLGTYNLGGSGSSDLKNEEETISAGIFSVKITDGAPGALNFYNFLDFSNFSSYIQSPGILRMKKKNEKDEDREYSINYRLLLHDILFLDSEMVFFAEVYYPEYRTVSYITYDYYGRPYPQSYTVFDGYQYLGGLSAGFNRQAIKTWDNGIKIWNIQSFTLSKKIAAYPDGSDLVLAYNAQGKIASEIYKHGEVVGDFEYVDLDTKYSKDRISKDVNSNMAHWYDHYFLCSGYQEIKNNALRGNNSRSVFYINKVAFE